MNKLESTRLEGCINSYINDISNTVDDYNIKNGITDIKSCVTKLNAARFIINLRYNPNLILGIINMKGDEISEILISRPHYNSAHLEYDLKKFIGHKLENSNGDVI